jgi:iron complex outermembrane receptor protein
VNQTSIGAFGLQEFDLEPLKLQFGGRVETNRYTPDGLRQRTFTGFSGAAGAILRLWEGGSFVGSYGNSYRAPALEELYNRGPHPGNLAFEIGDPDLIRERSHALEFGVRHGTSRMRGEVNYFHYRIRDYVFLERTGEVDHGLVVANYSQGNARYHGAEARLDLAVHPDFWINLGADSVDAKLTATGTPLPRIPPVRGRIGFDARYRGASFRPELLLAGAQEDLQPGETRTAGYGIVNLAASYTVVRPHVLHVFSANLFNAGDRLYRNHVSLIKDFAPEIGRGIRFAYTARFF